MHLRGAKPAGAVAQAAEATRVLAIIARCSLYCRMRWKPSPFITLSCTAHAAALAGVCAMPQHWPWMAGAVAANQLLLTGAGLW